MKHGLKLRKLQRTPSHRWALLRNLVSALLHHESIKTTLPKAKETARLAEKIITLGKKNTDPSRRAAMAFLMPGHHVNPASSSAFTSSSIASPSTEADPEDFQPSTSLLPKLFTTLSERYANRPGGYTRIHKFGRRPGDNAPHAILELVDGPKDIKFEMIARALGREHAQAGGSVGSSITAAGLEGDSELRKKTRQGLEKVLKYRSKEDEAELNARALEWSDMLLAEEKAFGGHRKLRDEVAVAPKSELARTKSPYQGRRYNAGERMGGMVASTGLGLARGNLGKFGRRGKAEVSDLEAKFLSEKIGQMSI